MNSRLIVAWALIPYAFWLAGDYSYHFIDGANLLIHEAGHLLFNFFGNRMLTAAGGTILQLSLPLMFSFHLYQRQERFGAAICGFWFGESLMYTAVYLGDAAAQRLPLWGNGEHDWTFLLSELRLLRYCEGIAAFLHFLALLIVFSCLHLLFRYVNDSVPQAGTADNENLSE